MDAEEYIRIQRKSENMMSGVLSLPEKTLAASYLSWIGTQDHYLMDIENVHVRKKPCGEKKPFLSIVTRTQGKRLEELQEAFLCLAGQEETDFELLLVGHNLDNGGITLIEGLVSRQPQWLQDKTWIVLVQGGNRTKPLNAAFFYAKGQYITIFDDDDIVFDNWVSSFKKLAKENMGCILYSFVLTQQWKVFLREDDTRILKAIEEPLPAYCDDFDVFEQMHTNHCPTMGLAFPSYVFQSLGFHFDEKLTTTEDWDFLMRAYFVCGIAVSETPTAIYRLWKHNDTSAVIHSKEEWDANRLAIQKKFINMPILLPEKSAEWLITHDGDGSFYSTVKPQEIKLYFDPGCGYSESRVIKPCLAKNSTTVFFFDEMEKYGILKSIRIDPRRKGFVTIEKLKITIFYPEGGISEMTSKEVLHNGFQMNDQKIVFLKDDPQFIVEFSQFRVISRVEISFLLREGASDHDIDYMLGTRIIAKGKEYLKRVIRIFKKRI